AIAARPRAAGCARSRIPARSRAAELGTRREDRQGARLIDVDASERYEQLIAFLSTHLPAPVEQEDHDGLLTFTGGSPGEVIARLTHTSVVIEEYAVRWETAFKPVLHPRRVGVVN